MEITWYGHSCFRITERGQTAVVCDPYDSQTVGYQPLKLKADIVTISHESPSHSFVKAVKSDPYIINGPGEYEIGGVFITGLRTDQHKKRENGQPVNTLYLIDFGGMNIVHLGDMLQVPSQAEVESLGPVHIALVPVGDAGSLNAAKASEVISLFEPNIVIPMHYQTPATNLKLDPIGKFLKEMGLSTVETLPSLKVASVAALPEETQVSVLDYPHE
ncbi:MAG: MBL fold metallo-hydrolase [Anaerolineae bacterium]|nr:MBL fold metallo-hydrolase [Anaerolineae bacterium]